MTPRPILIGGKGRLGFSALTLRATAACRARVCLDLTSEDVSYINPERRRTSRVISHKSRVTSHKLRVTAAGWSNLPFSRAFPSARRREWCGGGGSRAGGRASGSGRDDARRAKTCRRTSCRRQATFAICGQARRASPAQSVRRTGIKFC